MKQKESYYAALERQRAGETTLKERLERSAGSDQGDIEALETLYTEVGVKAFTAFNSCLDWLSRLGGGPERAALSHERLEETLRDAVGAGIGDLRQDIASVRERIGRLEGNIAAVEAGMRRIDKFTLEAFRNIQEIEERFHHVPTQGRQDGEGAVTERGRLPREEAAQLALDAGNRMRTEGRRLTLAAVAREAGLKYGQIVYAFGNKDGFLQALSSAARANTHAAELSDPQAGQVNRPGYEETASA